MKVKSLSRVGLIATPWTAAYQAPPSMGFSRQEYWSGLPLPSLVYLYSYTFIHMCTCAKLLQSYPTAPLSMGFSRQEYWRGLSFPSPGDLLDPEIELPPLCLLHWQGGSSPLAPPGKPILSTSLCKCIYVDICKFSSTYIQYRYKKKSCTNFKAIIIHKYTKFTTCYIL